MYNPFFNEWSEHVSDMRILFQKIPRTFFKELQVPGIIHMIMIIRVVVSDFYKNFRIFSKTMLWNTFLTKISQKILESFFDQGKSILFSLIIIHALNGLRLTVIDLGWGANKQKEIFWGFLVVGLSLMVYLLLKMPLQWPNYFLNVRHWFLLSKGMTVKFVMISGKILS